MIQIVLYKFRQNETINNILNLMKIDLNLDTLRILCYFIKQFFIHQMKSTSKSQTPTEIQGQCKILSVQPLKIYWCKAIPLTILSVLLIIPIILLIYSKYLRKQFFYTKCEFFQATTLYIESSGDDFDLVAVHTCNKDNSKVFYYKQLKFKLTENHYEPVVWDYQQFLKENDLNQYMKKGISQQQAIRHQQKYGKNAHKVKIPNYFIYVFGVMFRPLFLFQYVIVAVYVIQGIQIYGIVLVAASLLTTTLNYIVVCFNIRNIRKMAQKEQNAEVIREGVIKNIKSEEVVPGDIVILKKGSKFICDFLLIRGNMFVKESTLTGQATPIKKDEWKAGQDRKISLLYEGTQALQANSALGLAIYTGFASRKGQILRAILHQKYAQPDYFKSLYMLFAFAFIISIIFYCATLKIRLHVNIDRLFVGARVLDYTVAPIPPDFIIYITIAYSWAIFRLKRKNIISTILEKTVEANRLKIACFDKTGTLTQNSLSLLDVIFVENDKFTKFNYSSNAINMKPLIKIIFGTCHSVILVDSVESGDQIDLELWNKSNFKFHNRNDYSDITNQAGQKYRIIKVNQFNSQYQSMSVIVKQEQTGLLYIFAKGSPQKIMKNSKKKYVELDQIIEQQSFKGRRLIAFGYKSISESQLQESLNKDRQQLIKNIQFMGIACFQNPLKQQATHVIDSLQKCGVESKIITGDNINIAVQVAYRSHIVGKSEQIIILQGRNINQIDQNLQIEGTKVQMIQNQFKRQKISIKIKQLQECNAVLAIDNDFLNTKGFNLLKQMKIFSRILPDSKARVVSMIKKQTQYQYQNRSFCQKLFGEGRNKVAMVGDGANDLIAIKQADIGVAIGGTDAVYSSSFAISQLSGFINVFLQGKCTMSNIMDCLRFVLVSNFYNLVVECLLVTQATNLGQYQLLYMNFFSFVLTACLITATGPSENLTAQRVKDNFLNWKNMVIIWSRIVILAGGLVGSYFYLVNRPEYIPNPSPIWTIDNGYNPKCQLATAIFIMYGLTNTSIGLLMFSSKPFKKLIIFNIPYTLLLIVNFILFIVLCFIAQTTTNDLLQTVNVAKNIMGIMFLINVSSIIVAFIVKIGFQLTDKDNLTIQFPLRSQSKSVQQTKMSF